MDELKQKIKEALPKVKEWVFNDEKHHCTIKYQRGNCYCIIGKLASLIGVYGLDVHFVLDENNSCTIAYKWDQGLKKEAYNELEAIVRSW